MNSAAYTMLSNTPLEEKLAKVRPLDNRELYRGVSVTCVRRRAAVSGVTSRCGAPSIS